MKRDIIDTVGRLHVTAKGFAYPIDRLERFGPYLCMGREFRDHPTVRYLTAYLFPAQGWQVCRYTPHKGAHWCDWYVDICSIAETDGRLTVTDLYLDVAVHEGRSYDLLDCDEFGEAVTSGQLALPLMRSALESLQRLADALVRHEYRMEPLLESLLHPMAAAATRAAAVMPEKGKGALGRRPHLNKRSDH